MPCGGFVVELGYAYAVWILITLSVLVMLLSPTSPQSQSMFPGGPGSVGLLVAKKRWKPDKITHQIVYCCGFVGGCFTWRLVMFAFFFAKVFTFFVLWISSVMFACQLRCLNFFVTCLGDFKKFIQMVVKLTYAKERQKSYFFLKASCLEKSRCHDVSLHFMFIHCTSWPVFLFLPSPPLSKMFKGAKNYSHRGRLLRNAIPADPGGGVVFFVDPQGTSCQTMTGR